jgi:hypothetical protein
LAQRLARKKLEDVTGPRRFADPLRERLSFLSREQAPQLLSAREDLATDAIEGIGAYLDSALRPSGGRGIGGRVRANDVEDV